MNEARLAPLLRLEAAKWGGFLWRNNSGAFQDERGNFVRYGLANDSAKLNAVLKSSDLIGFTPVVIQAQHVGMRLAVFTAVECKHDGWRAPRDDRERAQQAFVDLVASNGGFGSFATCEADFKRLIGVG